MPGIWINNLRLNKLLYFAQVWNLFETGTPLFSDDIQAWKYGPVVDTVYKEFRKYGSSQITELYRDEVCNEYPMPDDKVKNFLNTIWKAYGHRTGVELSSLTHQPNTPWDIVWNKNGGKREMYAIIPNDLIKSHYKEKIQQVNAKSTPATQPAPANS